MPGFSKANLKKTYYYLKKNGLSATVYEVKGRLGKKEEYIPRTASVKKMTVEEVAGKEFPFFSILVPAYNTPELMLRQLLDSVAGQTYPKWELIIADGSDGDSVATAVKAYAASEERIKYHKLKENLGISGNTNQALEFATGDYVCLLDHDDFLETDALEIVAKKIAEIGSESVTASSRKQKPLLIYTDEDKCDESGKSFYEPNRKPDFNLDYLISNNYICHLMVLETETLRKLKFRKEFDGAQDHDIALRFVYEAGAEPIHIPEILYHWRCFGGSTSENPMDKLYAYDAGKKATQEAVTALGWKAETEHAEHMGFFKIKYKEDIFAGRSEVGAVGGLVIAKKSTGKIIGGPSEKDKCIFEGLPGKYSGPMNRRIISQETEGLDIRNISVRPELRQLFSEIVGVPYTETVDGNSGKKIFDYRTFVNGCKYKTLETGCEYITQDGSCDFAAVSRSLSDAIRAAGYKLVFLPEMETVWKK